MMCGRDCIFTVKAKFAELFRSYGEYVGTFPVGVILFTVAIFGGLGCGLLSIEAEDDMERVYFPKESQALDDREFVRKTFPDLRSYAYNSFSLSDLDDAATLYFM
jgi:predicted RND superfamily exporter protein